MYVCVCFPEEQEGAREAVTCSNLFTPGAVSPKLSGGVQGLGGARRARLVAGELLIAAVCGTHLTLDDPSHSKSGHAFSCHLEGLLYLLADCPGQKAVSSGVECLYVVTMTYI